MSIDSYKLGIFEVMKEDYHRNNINMGDYSFPSDESLINLKAEGWRIPTESELQYLREFREMEVLRFTNKKYMIDVERKVMGTYGFDMDRGRIFLINVGGCSLRLVRTL